MTNFWAKTTSDNRSGISVFQHMVNVGCVAKIIAESSPELLSRFDLLSRMVGGLAALHDIGKISPGFQRKCLEWLKENGLLDVAQRGCWDTGTESDHGKVSHAAIQDFLLQQGVVRSVAKYIAAVLGAHHGRLKYLPNGRGIRPPLIKPIAENLSSINWNEERLKEARAIWDFFDIDHCPSGDFSGESSAIWWLAGLVSVADWIGSDERFFPAEQEATDVDEYELARRALDAIGFLPPIITPNLTFQQIFEFSPNEVQTQSLAAIKSPGVYVIEAPMGMGKTEAALGAAYQLLETGRAAGIYFALPTQATSNRIHLRMNNFVDRISSTSRGSRLIHGNSWLLQDKLEYKPTVTNLKESAIEDARSGRDWFASAKRALLAPFGVGTVDQALLGVVAAKHFFVRHFALAGKVVILDEVHSYDLYTGTLIDKLITTLEGLGCTVIVLSATLTGQRREQIVAVTNEQGAQAYPLISGRTEGKVFAEGLSAEPESHDVKIEFQQRKTVMEEALKTASQGGAVLWICNTVDRAQKDFESFKGLKKTAQDNFPLGLLHSRFPHWRREELEQVWMERFGKEGKTRCGCILVSTQIVEQSVDLDADLLISELAPTDMLLQRLGRLWRHERKNRPLATPRICIIEENKTLEDFREMKAEGIARALGGKAKVYTPYVLLRSLELWKGVENITIPAQIRQLIEKTYLEREDEPESWQELFFESEAETLAYRQKALLSSNIWQVALDDKEGVQTRLNEMPTVSMVLCRDILKKGVRFVDDTEAKFSRDSFIFATAKAIHRNLVKVPEYCFDRVQSFTDFDEYIYEKQCAGLVADDGRVSVKGLKDEFSLYYTDETGLYIERMSGKEDI